LEKVTRKHLKKLRKRLTRFVAGSLNEIMRFIIPSILIFLWLCPMNSQAQEKLTKDSIVYRISYRDTVIYKYDTVKIRFYVRTDTVWNNDTVNPASAPSQKKRAFNPNAWGIGPTAGAYYSPINGFDVNIGFGVQYYLFAVPTFRNPHMKVKRQRKGR
jgi:hypothetical protein